MEKTVIYHNEIQDGVVTAKQTSSPPLAANEVQEYQSKVLFPALAKKQREDYKKILLDGGVNITKYKFLNHDENPADMFNATNIIPLHSEIQTLNILPDIPGEALYKIWFYEHSYDTPNPGDDFNLGILPHISKWDVDRDLSNRGGPSPWGNWKNVISSIDAPFQKPWILFDGPNFTGSIAKGYGSVHFLDYFNDRTQSIISGCIPMDVELLLQWAI